MKNDTQRTSQQMKDYEDFCQMYGTENHAIKMAKMGTNFSQSISLLIGDIFGKRPGTNQCTPPEISNLVNLEGYREVADFYEGEVFDETSEPLLVKTNNFILTLSKSKNSGSLLGGIENYFDTGDNKEFFEITVAGLYPAIIHQYGLLGKNVKQDTFTATYSRKFDNYLYGALRIKESKMCDLDIAPYVVRIALILMFDLLRQLENMSEIIQVDTDTIIISPYVEFSIIKNALRVWAEKSKMKIMYMPFKGIYQRRVKEYIIVYNDGTYRAKGINKNRSEISSMFAI